MSFVIRSHVGSRAIVVQVSRTSLSLVSICPQGKVLFGLGVGIKDEGGCSESSRRISWAQDANRAISVAVTAWTSGLGVWSDGRHAICPLRVTSVPSHLAVTMPGCLLTYGASSITRVQKKRSFMTCNLHTAIRKVADCLAGWRDNLHYSSMNTRPSHHYLGARRALCIFWNFVFLRY